MKKGDHPKKDSRLSAGRGARRLPASIPLLDRLLIIDS